IIKYEIYESMCRGRARASLTLPKMFFVIAISVLPFLLHAEHPDSTIMKLENQKLNIAYASKIFDINFDYLKSITYVERTNNYNWQDEYFDDYLAKKGQNSSIGFCQVKMKTAYWIECQLADSLSEFYPGKKYEDLLQVSQSPQEIIDKLEDDQTNLLYASAYMRIIQSYWESKGYSIDNRVDIIATIFSYGIFSRSTGEPLKPNSDPKPNRFGGEALEVYKRFTK
ncbi:MAG: hypothetical protein U9Q91_08095, partial [Candidatus Marinimicrobia bacterium]|nr:hypothetical protein [Candidatus Neomarinimicrobiota bacterium]